MPWLLQGLAALTGLVLLLVAAAMVCVQRSFPSLDGCLPVAGLTSLASTRCLTGMVHVFNCLRCREQLDK